MNDVVGVGRRTTVPVSYSYLRNEIRATINMLRGELLESFNAKLFRRTTTSGISHLRFATHALVLSLPLTIRIKYESNGILFLSRENLSSLTNSPTPPLRLPFPFSQSPKYTN